MVAGTSKGRWGSREISFNVGKITASLYTSKNDPVEGNIWMNKIGWRISEGGRGRMLLE